MESIFNSQLIDDSASFAAFFEDRFQAIEQAAEKNYLRKIEEGSRAEFLNLISQWCQAVGATEVCPKVDLWKDKKLTMSDVVDDLLSLSLFSLSKLENSYSNIVQGDVDQSTDPSGVPLLNFLKDKQHRQNRTECGQFLLGLSQAARCVREMKQGLTSYHPSTLGKIEMIRQGMEDKDVKEEENDLCRDVLSAIELIRQPINKFKRTAVETNKWKASLEDQKSFFMSRSLEACRQSLTKVGKGVHRVLSAVETWLDTKVALALEPLNLKDSMGETLGELQELIVQRLDEFEKLLVNLKDLPPQSLRGIAPFFLETLVRHEKLYNQSMRSGLFKEPAVRRRFTILLNWIAEIKVKLAVVVRQETKELSEYPDFFRQQLRYFQLEVPEIVMRGKKGEMKNLANVVKHCYQGIDRDKNLQQKHKPKVLRTHYTEVVVNSTSLMRKP